MRLRDPHSSWPPQRLFAMLKDSQAQERESWKNSLLTDGIDKVTDVGPSERDLAVSWMAHLNTQFGFYPETFFLGAHCLDRFLTCVKSRRKYLKCIALTCLYLASKIMEEEEVIPGTAQLVENSDCGCRVQDILRMERIVLTKLDWCIMTPTVFTYLQIFHSLAFTHHSNTPPSADAETVSSQKSTFFRRHFDILTGELQRAVSTYNIVEFPSSAVALALLSLEIESLSADSSGWTVVTSRLQAYANIKTDKLMGCREALISFLPRRLCNPKLNNPVYIVANPGQKEASTSNDRRHAAVQGGAVKRKANDSNTAVMGFDQVKKIHTLEENRPVTHIRSDSMLSEPRYLDQHGNGTSLVLPDLATVRRTVSDEADNVALDGQSIGTDSPAYTVMADSEAGPSFPNLSPPASSVEELLCDEFDAGPPLAQPFFGNLLADGGIPLDGKWTPPQPDRAENADEYDSDQTLTASEAEEDEDEFSEQEKHEATRLRPLTYAEIVKCGIIESTATIVTVANVTKACF